MSCTQGKQYPVCIKSLSFSFGVYDFVVHMHIVLLSGVQLVFFYVMQWQQQMIITNRV